MALLSEEFSEEVIQLQRAALLEKVRSGAPLNRGELEQLGLGGDKGGDKPGDKAAALSPGLSRLDLSSAREIADWWGTSPRTVERHRPAGLPFLEPWAVLDWWGDNSKKKPPAWLMDGVERWRRDVAAAEVDVPVAAPEASVSESYEMGGEGEWPIEEQVRTMRRIARGYSLKLEELACGGEEFARVDRLYQSAATKLRSLEKDAPRIAIEQGRAWAREEVAATLTDVGTAMNAALDRFALLLAPLVAGQDVNRCAEIISREVDRLRQPWSRCVNQITT